MRCSHTGLAYVSPSLGYHSTTCSTGASNPPAVACDFSRPRCQVSRGRDTSRGHLLHTLTGQTGVSIHLP